MTSLRFRAGSARAFRQSAPFLALMVLALAAGGCDNSSTGPLRDTLLIEGDLEYRGDNSHEFAAMDDGIAQFEVVDLKPKILDISAGRNITVGVGLGRPGTNEDGTARCVTTFTATARRGSIFSIGLDEDTLYCVRVFDAGFLPEDAVITYMISVSPD